MYLQVAKQNKRDLARLEDHSPPEKRKSFLLRVPDLASVAILCGMPSFLFSCSTSSAQILTGDRCCRLHSYESRSASLHLLVGSVTVLLRNPGTAYVECLN